VSGAVADNSDPLRLIGPVPLLQVFDMSASVAFYRDVLGFSVVQDSGVRDTPEGRFAHWNWLRNGDAELMLNTAYDEGERPAAPDPSRQLAHGDLCLYFGSPNIDALFAAIAARIPGAPSPVTTRYGMRQLTLTDPDGYQVCFQAPA
jgi:catechol 2,3-dioxygenase-like lactoylglutathione lyase family enzyme